MEPPYYSDDLVTIYHGDCRDVLPTLTDVRAIVTDPPYGLDFRGKEWDASIPFEWLTLAREKAPSVVFTTAPTTAWDYPRPDWIACWFRPGSTSRTTTGQFNHWSPVLVYGKHNLNPDSIRLPDASNHAPSWIRHPSPKPEKLMRWLIAGVSDPGDLIVDPFMGSGTTLRGAKDLQRRAIGIEREEEYCEMAVQRLGQEVLF